MAKQDYLPDEIDDLDTWYQTWQNNIAAVLAALGLPLTHADAVKVKVTKERDSFQKWKDKKAEAVSFSDIFKADRKATEAVVRPYSKNLKTTTGYTPAIGDTIGIEGLEESVDPATAKPVIKGSYTGGEGVLKFKNHKAARSVRFTSKRGSETAFTYLADDTNSPYPDARANIDPAKPETREYIGQYVNVDGDLIGFPSDKITITFPAA
ncbi:MAG TPA: hypothetical protein VI757_04815 [Bacteroidia bacterium]|nr:hypothetical protein [Bacteroidia bacterium]